MSMSSRPFFWSEYPGQRQVFRFTKTKLYTIKSKSVEVQTRRYYEALHAWAGASPTYSSLHTWPGKIRACKQAVLKGMWTDSQEYRPDTKLSKLDNHPLMLCEEDNTHVHCLEGMISCRSRHHIHLHPLVCYSLQHDILSLSCKCVCPSLQMEACVRGLLPGNF